MVVDVIATTWPPSQFTIPPEGAPNLGSALLAVRTEDTVQKNFQPVGGLVGLAGIPLVQPRPVAEANG